MRWPLLFVAVITLGACRKATQPPVVGDAALADSAEQVMFDVHYVLTNRGVKRGDMYADTVYVFNDQTQYAMRRVRATFNTETGAPNGTIRGDRGTWNLRQQVLEGFGNVVATSTDGKRLTSNHLRYSQTKNEISSDSAFTLTEPAGVQRGIGFTSDPNIRLFKCHRACGGEARVPLGNLSP